MLTYRNLLLISFAFISAHSAFAQDDKKPTPRLSVKTVPPKFGPAINPVQQGYTKWGHVFISPDMKQLLDEQKAAQKAEDQRRAEEARRREEERRDQEQKQLQAAAAALFCLHKNK